MLILLDYQNSMKIIGFLADKIKTMKKKFSCNFYFTEFVTLPCENNFY